MAALGNILGGSIFSEPFPRVNGISDPVLIAIRQNCQDVVKACKDQNFTLNDIERLRNCIMAPMRKYYSVAFDRLWNKARQATDFDHDLKSVAKDVVIAAITGAMSASKGPVPSVASAGDTVSAMANQAYSQLDHGINQTLARPIAGAYSAQQKCVKVLTGIFGDNALNRLTGRCAGALYDAFCEAIGKKTELREFYDKETDRITRQYTESVKWVDDQFNDIRNATFQHGKDTVSDVVKSFFETHNVVQDFATYTRSSPAEVLAKLGDWLNQSHDFKGTVNLFLQSKGLLNEYSEKFVQATGSFDLAR